MSKNILQQKVKQKLLFPQAPPEDPFRFKRKEEREQEELVGPQDMYFWQREEK